MKMRRTRTMMQGSSSSSSSSAVSPTRLGRFRSHGRPSHPFRARKQGTDTTAATAGRACTPPMRAKKIETAGPDLRKGRWPRGPSPGPLPVAAQSA
jgi:hypothetical protein